METRAWWQARQSDAQQSAEKSIAVMADDLRRRFQTLGVVTSAMLGQFGGRLGLTAAQASQAAQRAADRDAQAHAFAAGGGGARAQILHRGK